MCSSQQAGDDGVCVSSIHTHIHTDRTHPLFCILHLVPSHPLYQPSARKHPANQPEITHTHTHRPLSARRATHTRSAYDGKPSEQNLHFLVYACTSFCVCVYDTRRAHTMLCSCSVYIIMYRGSRMYGAHIYDWMRVRLACIYRMAFSRIPCAYAFVSALHKP